MSNQKKADLMLLLVTLFWGASYYMIDISLRDLQPMTLNAIRFVVAFLLVFVIFFKKLLKINLPTLKYAFIAGIAMGGAYFFCTTGVMYTSLSNAGFLGALSVVFTPILGLLFKRQIPDKKFILVVALCVIGVGLLTISESFRPDFGDIFCIAGSLCFAANLLVTETAVKNEKVDSFNMAVYELGFIGVAMTIGAFIFEEPTLPQSAVTWGTTLFLAIFCSGVSIIIQVLAQRYTTANHVGILYTLEPLFVAVIAFFLAGEVLSYRAYGGAALMMFSIVLMEVDFGAITLGRRKQKI